MKKKLLSIMLSLTTLTSLTGCGTTFDASGYVTGYLDASFMGDFDEFASLCQMKTSEIEAIYDSQLDTIYSSWTANIALNDEDSTVLHEKIASILKNAKYSVSEATKNGKEYQVTVEIQPLILEMTQKDGNEVANKAKEEYVKQYPSDTQIDQEKFYDIWADYYADYLETFVSSPTYGDKEAVTVTVAENNNHKYALSDEDQTKLGSTVIKSSAK